MRIDHLALGPVEDQAVIRFHPRITVVSGMEAVERAEMTELIVGSLTGGKSEVTGMQLWTAGDVALTLTRDENGARWTTPDGKPSPAPTELLGTDATSLRRLIVLRPSDVSAIRSGTIASANSELETAREALEGVEIQLAAAFERRARVDDLRAELAMLDESLHRANDDVEKRRFARLLRELEAVRSEAESIRGGAMAMAADRRLIAAASEVESRLDHYRTVFERLQAQQDQFGARDRLDPRTLAEALASPEQVPAGLDALAGQYEAAAATRALLEERLTSVAAGSLPEPSHPAVVRLAHADQDHVWLTARTATDAAHRLEDQSLALGGLEAEGIAPPAAADLEDAHHTVDLAIRVVEARRLKGLIGILAGAIIGLGLMFITPLMAGIGVCIIGAAGWWSMVAPTRELRRQRATEQKALKRAGVPTYIGFQLRRLEVTINPAATEPLELAALEYRRAITAWRELAGDVAPGEALALEAEVRAYTASLASVQGSAADMAETRHRIADADATLAQAKSQLLAACAPFGIQDPALAAAMVRFQASTSGHARLQHTLELAEGEEARAMALVEETLASMGFEQGDLSDRLEGFQTALDAADRREGARQKARPPEQIESDLARLEAQVRAEGRPEWASTVSSSDGDEPDVAALTRRREEALTEFLEASRMVPDIDRLSDRCEALARRVQVLSDGATQPTASLGAGDLEQLFNTRIASARRHGPGGEPPPLVLDDPFEDLHGERKWAVLEALERLSAQVQLIYLTNDVDTIVWARRRAQPEVLSLLEPVSDRV